MNGKKQDVLITNVRRNDPLTGVDIVEDHELTIWADDGMESIIKKVEGVSFVFHGLRTYYGVSLDPRYDAEYVKAEIEAAILCAGGDK